MRPYSTKMSTKFYNNFTLGIVGGGQLGRMLIQDAISFDIDTHVLDSDVNAPCKHICNQFEVGNLKDFDTVYNFGKQCTLVTIEFEHINADALQKLEDEGIKVFPQPRVLKLVQDKGLQKQFYKDNNIPSSDFILVNSKEELKANANFFPCFQKMRKSGYDGKGVIKLNSINDIDKAFDEPSILETLIDFEKELSVIVARNEKGQISHFPAVEMEFSAEANLVEFLFSPANISKQVEEEAIRIARTIAEKLQIVGILAVELFLTKDGKVLVNEIAPRPHNSGHQSIEGNYTSQYEQHLRAILNLPLGNTAIKKPSVMVNVLGEKGYEGPVVYEGIDEILAMDGVKLHLYGKKNTKSFRKMGHITVIDETIESAKQKAKLVKEKLRVVSGK